jgi:hypothetical protein
VKTTPQEQEFPSNLPSRDVALDLQWQPPTHSACRTVSARIHDTQEVVEHREEIVIPESFHNPSSSSQKEMSSAHRAAKLDWSPVSREKKLKP